MKEKVIQTDEEQRIVKIKPHYKSTDVSTTTETTPMKSRPV